MSKPGPAPAFTQAETKKYEEFLQINDINQKRAQYMSFTPEERERYKLWIEKVAKPRQELSKKESEESKKRQEALKQQLDEDNLKIKNLQNNKKEIFVQFGSKITNDLDKIRVQQSHSVRPGQKLI